MFTESGGNATAPRKTIYNVNLSILITSAVHTHCTLVQYAKCMFPIIAQDTAVGICDVNSESKLVLQAS